MKKLRLVTCATMMIAMAACSHDEGSSTDKVEVSGPMTDSGAPAPAPTADANVVELVPAQEGQQPLAVSAGQTVSGEFPVPKAGTLSAVSFFIGNYVNTSDGDLQVKICQAGKCSEGAAPIAGSQDNAYLDVKLSSPLPVAQGAATYDVTKSGGANVVALWTYAPSGSMTSITTADGSSLPRIPRVALRYQP